MTAIRRPITGRFFTTVIAFELCMVALVSWVMAGAPGWRRDEAPPSVTIQFSPAHAPGALVRVHNI